MTDSCMEICFTQLRVTVIFEHEHFTRYSRNAFNVLRDIKLLVCQKFTAKFVGERMLKIGQHLANLEAKAVWHHFQDTVY